jgi:ABC-2 type transport system permease protein
MSAITATQTTARRPAWTRNAGLKQLVVTELRLALRERTPIFGLALPVVLLVILASIPAMRKPEASLSGYTLLDTYVPIVILMSVALLTLIPMPMALVGYRERGVLRRLQTTPAGPVRVLAAQLAVNFILAITATAIVLLVARVGYGVFLPRQFGGFVVCVVLALAAMLGLGLFIAAIAPTVKGAQVIGALLFYPMLFFSGLWYPIPLMSAGLQHVAHATPLGAAWEAMASAGAGQWPPALPLVTLAVYAVGFGLAAARFFRWE